MTTPPDWIRAAAEEIEDVYEPPGGFSSLVSSASGRLSPRAEKAGSIIRKHCPMEDGVAYMPVPRCETCRHWERGAQWGDGSFLSESSRDGRSWGHCSRFDCGGDELRGAHAYDTQLNTADSFGCVEHEPGEGE